MMATGVVGVHGAPVVFHVDGARDKEPEDVAQSGQVWMKPWPGVQREKWMSRQRCAVLILRRLALFKKWVC